MFTFATLHVLLTPLTLPHVLVALAVNASTIPALHTNLNKQYNASSIALKPAYSPGSGRIVYIDNCVPIDNTLVCCKRSASYLNERLNLL